MQHMEFDFESELCQAWHGELHLCGYQFIYEYCDKLSELLMQYALGVFCY